MNRKQLNEVLRKHKLWLDDADGGERADLRYKYLHGAKMRCANLRDANLQDANLQCADMRCANLQCANLRCADLQHANMRYADLRYADLRYADLWYANMQEANLQGANMQGALMRYADMRGADIDYSAWPLRCGSLQAHVDDRIAIQLLYHTLSVVQHSPYVSADIKRTLLTPDVVGVANRFHRVNECGELEAFNGGANE